MAIDMDGDLIDDIRRGSYSIVQLRAENARLQSALAQAAANEADAVRRAQEAEAELKRWKSAYHDARAEVERLNRRLDRVAMEEDIDE